MAKRVWLLLESPSGRSMYISDNPVTLHNEREFGPYGNIGLAVLGIQIYGPLAPRLTLAFFCPSVTEPFQRAGRNLKFIDSVAPGEADAILKNPAFLRSLCGGLESGASIRCVDDSVMMNSLQVIYSSRFVYSDSADFSLVERMLKDNTKYRHGLRMTL